MTLPALAVPQSRQGDRAGQLAMRRWIGSSGSRQRPTALMQGSRTPDVVGSPGRLSPSTLIPRGHGLTPGHTVCPT
jgi:hypothetical protein